MTLNRLKPKVNAIIASRATPINEKMMAICKLLQKEITTYDWVGFYMANHNTKTLHLGPYAGAATDHTVIPFGKGICGQVAISNQNFVVPDVKAQDNYIACSITVKSEIVVPIFKDGKNIGQIDIDSNTADAFTHEDEKFLTWINEQLSPLL